MIFGIKTKKDKRIENLENMLFATRLQTPMPITIEKNIVTLGASQVLSNEMPVEYVKDHIARMMVEKVRDQIFYDLEEHNGIRVMHGYLRIVID